MSFKSILSSAAVAVQSVPTRELDPEAGFQFSQPKMHVFGAGDENKLAARVKKMTDDMTMVDYDDVERPISVNGTIGKYELTESAFGDLLRFADFGSRDFVKLSRIDAEYAARTVDLILDERRGLLNNVMAVIDEPTNRIDAFVSRSYRPFTNVQMLDAAMGYEGMELAQAAIEGQRLNISVVSPKLDFDVNPQVGDTVRFGASMDNSVDGKVAVHASTYNEVLRCTNGAVGRARGEFVKIRHSGAGLSERVMAGVDSIMLRTMDRVGIMRLAAEFHPDNDQIDTLREWLESATNGGSRGMMMTTMQQAVVEAKKDGREDGSMTLWNIVNAITEQAHHVDTINRRQKIQSMGMTALDKFGGVWMRKELKALSKAP